MSLGQTPRVTCDALVQVVGMREGPRVLGHSFFLLLSFFCECFSSLINTVIQRHRCGVCFWVDGGRFDPSTRPLFNISMVHMTKSLPGVGYAVQACGLEVVQVYVHTSSVGGPSKLFGAPFWQHHHLRLLLSSFSCRSILVCCNKWCLTCVRFLLWTNACTLQVSLYG